MAITYVCVCVVDDDSERNPEENSQEDTHEHTQESDDLLQHGGVIQADFMTAGHGRAVIDDVAGRLHRFVLETGWDSMYNLL